MTEFQLGFLAGILSISALIAGLFVSIMLTDKELKKEVKR